MKRWIPIITIFTATLSTFGCSMCCGPFDFDYANFGGKHERIDPQYGRVGSIFSDPNAGFMGPGADSNLAPPPEPRDSTFDEDLELDQMRQDFEDDLESIDPLNDTNDSGTESLPGPDDEGPTASRPIKNRLRPFQTWR